MKRVYAALATAAILVALIPATAAAGRVTKSTEQYVFVGCDAPIDGGFASVFLDHNTEAEFEFPGRQHRGSIPRCPVEE